MSSKLLFRHVTQLLGLYFILTYIYHVDAALVSKLSTGRALTHHTELASTWAGSDKPTRKQGARLERLIRTTALCTEY